MTILLAVDLGAESGRVVRGVFSGGRLTVDETFRFPTGMTRIDGHLRWDLGRIFPDLMQALRAAGRKGGVVSLGVDTWGVDFGLLAERERLIEPPVAYRDERTEGVMEDFHAVVPAADIYGRTGIQFLPFNTLYQLAALSASGDPALDRARHLLLMADLAHHHLTGERATEITNATTTQCFDPVGLDWDHTLLEAAGIEPSLMQEVARPGTHLGPLLREVQDATGLGPVPVVLPATHDTASAVAAVPAKGQGWAFVSSGTWSLVGVETAAPLITEAARRWNFTNEGGACGTNRFLKNVMGLWLLQRIRAERAGSTDYETLVGRAADAAPLRSLIDPDDPRFLNPASMADAIAGFCAETGQPVPDSTAGYARCALESLALRYRAVLADIESVTGRRIETVHVVGGGARNRLLNQMTADATGRPVLAGPVEATAIGNLLVQAMPAGIIGGLQEGRDLVRRSCPPELFEPAGGARWEEASLRFPGRRSES